MKLEDGLILVDQLTDAGLIQSIAAREIWAMETLYIRYNRALYSYSYLRVKDPQIAENLAQETFLAVWRSAKTYDPRAGSVRTWLLSIVRHRAIDYLRALQRRSTLLEINLDAIGEEELPLVPDVWDEVWKSLLIKQVRAALLHLPIEQQKVIELQYFQGWTQSEIAQECHIPLGTVKGRIRMGILHLKRILDHVRCEESKSAHDAIFPVSQLTKVGEDYYCAEHMPLLPQE